MVCKDDPCKYSTCKKYEDKNPVCRSVTKAMVQTETIEFHYRTQY